MSKFIKNEWLIASLKELGIKKYTSIQNTTIPKILNGENCIGVSPTGTGKTYCFLIPILEKLSNDKSLQVLIVLPTRELARQIYSKFTYFKKFHNFTIKLLIGGNNKDEFKNEQIIVCTPQKIAELLSNKKINLGKLKTIVFDEADMMIDESSSDLFKNIFELLPSKNKIQKIAFSATLHEMLANQLSIYFKQTKIYDVNQSIWKNKNKIEHNLIHFDNHQNRDDVLEKIVMELDPFFCIIFANRKVEVENIYKLFKIKGLDIMMLHGDLEARERKNVYKQIEKKALRFLVSTDLASRGIDIEGVSHIISYNLPDEDLWFMHRIGRTGRNYQTGITFSLAEGRDALKVSRLKEKGIDWNNFKIIKNKLENYNYQFLRKPKRKNSEVDQEIKFIISTASKKVKPNYKKKTKLKIKEVKRKAKRTAIEKAVKKNLIKKYKKESAKKAKKNEVQI